jgi:hypothetical protein
MCQVVMKKDQEYKTDFIFSKQIEVVVAEKASWAMTNIRFGN